MVPAACCGTRCCNVQRASAKIFRNDTSGTTRRGGRVDREISAGGKVCCTVPRKNTTDFQCLSLCPLW